MSGPSTRVDAGAHDPAGRGVDELSPLSLRDWPADLAVSSSSRRKPAELGQRLQLLRAVED